MLTGQKSRVELRSLYFRCSPPPSKMHQHEASAMLAFCFPAIIHPAFMLSIGRCERRQLRQVSHHFPIRRNAPCRKSVSRPSHRRVIVDDLAQGPGDAISRACCFFVVWLIHCVFLRSANEDTLNKATVNYRLSGSPLRRFALRWRMGRP